MQTSEEILFARHRGGVECVPVGRGDCSLALLAHLGPQMMSFPIKIIGLDRKQKSFHVRFVQKYETNYYLGSSSCLLEKGEGILLSSGINSLLFFTYLLLLINQKQGFNQGRRN